MKILKLSLIQFHAHYLKNSTNLNLKFLMLLIQFCLLYTSDAADERSSVDLGGRRIIKKKKEELERHSTFATSQRSST